MTQNKIPTDEDFAEGWWTVWAGTKSELLDFIKAVRAAGREEQKEKDIVICHQHLLGDVGVFPEEEAANDWTCNKIAEAIRAQEVSSE